MHSFISVWRLTRFEGSVTLGCEPPAIAGTSMDILIMLTTGIANLWLGRQGQHFIYKRSVKRWPGREGNPLTRDNSPPYKEALSSPWRPTETSTYYGIAITIAALNLLPLLFF